MNWAYQAIETIKRMKISHRNWTFALNDAFALLIASARGEVVCITGPSRAGKSKLIKALIKLLIGSKAYVDNGVMSVISVLAENCSTNGNFSSKAFTIKMLEAIAHPIYGVVSEDTEKEIKRLRSLERTPESILRPALEAALKARKTRYIFIDEAQHIQYAQRGSKGASAILESWKCLAESTGTTLVLVGAYPLLDIIKLCPHLLGRKKQVHLPRYIYESNDLMAFTEIVDTYGGELVLPAGVESLNEWSEYLYEGSMGCIGLLEGWIRAALGHVISYGNNEITLEHFKLARRPKSEETEIANEIYEGEKTLEVKVSELRDENHILDSKSNKPKGKPFQRNPKRYGIGDRNKKD